MYRLVRFFKRYYAVFLFVLLEAGAISYYANSTSYTRATLLAGAARVTGGIEGFFASAGDYFSLRRENAVLLERLAEAETRLHAAIPADDTLAARTDGMKYLFGTAKVVSNSIARQDNFFVMVPPTASKRTWRYCRRKVPSRVMSAGTPTITQSACRYSTAVSA